MARAQASFHFITDERTPVDEVIRTAVASVDGGADVVQLRAKAIDARTLVSWAVALSGAIDGRASVLINDRVDVAIAARRVGARIDGVHLGQSDIDPVTARDLLGPHAIIGWTANTAEHRSAAAALPNGTLSYLGVGAIRATATKPDAPAAIGIDGFAAFAAGTALPCIAIGGLTVADAHPLMVAGAAGIAVVSAVSQADNPQAAAEAFVRELRKEPS